MTANDVLYWLNWGATFSRLTYFTLDGIDSFVILHSAMRCVECLENTRQRMLYPCKNCEVKPRRRYAEGPWPCHKCRNHLCEDRCDTLAFGVTEDDEELEVQRISILVRKFDEDTLSGYLEELQRRTYQMMNEGGYGGRDKYGQLAVALSYAITAARRTKEMRAWLERRCEPDRWSSVSETYAAIAKCLQWWCPDWQPYHESWWDQIEGIHTDNGFPRADV